MGARKKTYSSVYSSIKPQSSSLNKRKPPKQSSKPKKSQKREEVKEE